MISSAIFLAENFALSGIELVSLFKNIHVRKVRNEEVYNIDYIKVKQSMNNTKFYYCYSENRIKLAESINDAIQFVDKDAKAILNILKNM